MNKSAKNPLLRRNWNPIDIETSINTGFLVFRDKQDPRIFGKIYQLAITILGLWISNKLINSHKILIGFLGIGFFGILGMYGIYANLIENKLVRIKTGLFQEENGAVIYKFLSQRCSEIEKKSPELIIALESLHFSFRTLYFIIRENEIYFNNQVYTGWTFALPDLLRRWVIREQLIKFIDKYRQDAKHLNKSL